MRGFSYICLLALLTLTCLPATATPTLTQAMAARVRPAMQVASKPAVRDAELAITVDTPLGPLDLLLQPAAQMRAQAAPWVASIRHGDTQVYRGHVAGAPENWVRMTRIKGAWLGAIRDGSRLWLLDPARDHPHMAALAGTDSKGTLVFNLDDFTNLRQVDFGGLQLPLVVQSHVQPSRSDNSAMASTTTYHLGVSLVLDTQFQAHYGSTAQSTAVGILNIVDGFYSSQVNTQVYLHALKSLPSNGRMTATDARILLSQFVAYLPGSSIPFSGLIHLLSGKDFDNNIAGIAYIGSLCNPIYGSGIDQANFSAAASATILAHEIGHNYGASHDSNNNSCPASGFIMNAVTSLGNPPMHFSTCSLQHFNNYRNNANPQCLTALPDLIFRNTFE